ncbi:major capsid protein [Roseobacter phage RD-1410Ws-07]|uniref:Major capsid protein n=2 Tax=Sanyabayvirus DS1410Ws06 TaxID=2844087 RepID=A0A191VYT5_9CAUD|nr:major head protein [Dinoroseobacter phage DS-1410Ws-06]ANJ20720.1 major capsid protein [Dinoroseobacter phage DS-1410Ws-06]ANJ20871.1 major capsid protein [Roseobacter phage RD-1410Ws-07]
MTQIYNAPEVNVAGNQSSVGPQFNTHYWDRKSLIDAAEEMYFSPLADVRSMPKHYGKELRVYYYVPLLDELNVNDQGIDALGAARVPGTFTVTFPVTGVRVANAGSAAAVTAINNNVSAADGSAVVVASDAADDTGGTGLTLLGMTTNVVEYADEATADAAIAAAGAGVKQENVGALYGGSRDVGTILGKMPTLTEQGGRVNRVGFTRLERKGEIQEYGFFMEWTEDSLMFDTDSDLYGHLSREMLRGANEINEDLLQADLLNAADVKVFPGVATAIHEISGESGSVDLLDVGDLKRLSVTLDDNRTPKKTTIIKGSRMTDTRVISASRIAYIGSELQIMISDWADFVPVEQYADAATIMNGEIGAIPTAHLRIVVVPQMMRWQGVGAAESTNGGYQATGGKYDVAPLLVIGDQAFATIGLQGMGTGAKAKFRIIVKKPGEKTADRTDPYGKIGFSSVKFFYGFIKLRGERMAVAYSPIPD